MSMGIGIMLPPHQYVSNDATFAMNLLFATRKVRMEPRKTTRINTSYNKVDACEKGRQNNLVCTN